MDNAIKVVLAIAGISLVIGIISRILVAPVPTGNGGIEAQAFLQFTNTCLLAVIVFKLLEKK